VPIYEPGLDKLIAHNVEESRLAFTTDMAAAVTGAEVVVLAVGTRRRPTARLICTTFFRPQRRPHARFRAGPCW